MRIRMPIGALMIGALLAAVGCSPPPARSDTAIASSAALQSIADWKATYRPPSSVRPSRLAPSPLTDAPILTLRSLPNGGSCNYDAKLLVPDLAVYADGRVIASATDATGFFCAAVPTFRMGRSDVAALRALVEKYLRSKESAVDLSDNPNVADGVLTRLEYLGTDGTRRSITVDALHETEVMPDGQRVARIAFRDLVNRITTSARADRGPWVPRRVMVVKPDASISSDGQATPWPVAVTPELRRLMNGPAGGCLTVTGSAAATVLAAAQAKPTAAGPWTVDGKRTFLAIGVTLDGLRPCSPVVIGQ